MNRNIYVITYIASIILAALIWYFTKQNLVLVACLFAFRFAVNFYYGHTLQVNTAPKIFSSIFSSIGFLFLMGYDKKIMGAWEIFVLGLKVYKKNFWYLLSYVLIIILLNVILALLSGLLFGIVTWLLGSSIIGAILKAVILLVYAIATIVFSLMVYLASLMAIKEAHIGQASFNNIVNNIKLSYKHLWSFIGASILKFIVANGPIVIGMLGFIIFALSSMWSTISTGVLPPGLLQFSAFNIITGIIVIYGLFHSFYFLVRLLFYVYGIVFENKKAKASLYYSMEISKNKWWQLLWRLFIPSWLLGLVAVILIFSIQYVVPSESIAVVISYIIQIIIWPLTFLFPYLLYENIKPGSNAPVAQPVSTEEPRLENIEK